MTKRLLVLILSILSPVLAAPTAAIMGTVRDSSGSVIVGAAVRIRNIETGVIRSTATNEVGTYQILGLQAGRYELSASMAKFNTVRQNGIALHVGDEVRLDLALTPGNAHEAVIVTEAAPLTQTESAAVSTVVNERAIQELPSDGRQLQNLALIVPGIDVGWNLSTAANRYGKARENTEGAFSVGGARSRSNDFLFDGMPMNLRQYSVINFEPSNEAVQEFAVLSAIPPAEYGRTMGGQVNIVTRAGSSRFHGSWLGRRSSAIRKPRLPVGSPAVFTWKSDSLSGLRPVDIEPGNAVGEK